MTTVNTLARQNTISVLRNDLDACPDVEDVLAYPEGSLNDVWLMPMHTSDADLFFRMWFVENFASSEVYQRALAINRAVDGFASDLAKMGYDKTGKPTYIHRRVQSALKCRLVSAQWPTLRTIVNEATTVPARKAQGNLERLCMEGGQWLVR